MLPLRSRRAVGEDIFWARRNWHSMGSALISLKARLRSTSSA